VPIIKLNLSYNKFGSEGLKNLSIGLSENNTLEELTLNYCDINFEGAFFLQEILSYHDSKIEVLSLIGNQLRNEGVYQLFRALEANEALSELYIGNNQFGES
jgi:Ran GTPase-activating protein (RanGAP) involved in mRNA processing and transport